MRAECVSRSVRLETHIRSESVSRSALLETHMRAEYVWETGRRPELQDQLQDPTFEASGEQRRRARRKASTHCVRCTADWTRTATAAAWETGMRPELQAQLQDPTFETGEAEAMRAWQPKP